MWDTNFEKLAQTWEGPYRVTAIAGARAYYLEDLDERPLPWPWNVHNLRKFYHWLFVHGSVNPNMYILLANIMLMLLVASAFNFIIMYSVVPANKYRGNEKDLGRSPKGQKPISRFDYYHWIGGNLTLKNIQRTETCFSVWFLSPSRWKPYTENIQRIETYFSVRLSSPSR